MQRVLSFIHAVGFVQGDLSLLSAGGNGGLPQGHIVAYRADHALHVQFAKELLGTVSSADMKQVKIVSQ